MRTAGAQRVPHWYLQHAHVSSSRQMIIPIGFKAEIVSQSIQWDTMESGSVSI